MSTKRNMILGLHLGCDLIMHLKDASEPVWPILMPDVFRALNDEDSDARTAACFAINVAAPLPNFTLAAPEAFRCLAQLLVVGPRVKRRDDKTRIAFEHAVAAIFNLAR